MGKPETASSSEPDGPDDLGIVSWKVSTEKS
jgi:hypothetical protein